ncbi:MAG: hypothetical protein OWU84_00940 [Firmicutes bacterium]|nr:hypothetical protein [Bacillota bacterium]
MEATVGLWMMALASVGYGGAALFSVAQLYRPHIERWTFAWASLGWFGETLWLFHHGHAARFLVTRDGTVSMMVWLLVALFFLAQRSSLRTCGSFLLPVGFVLWAIDRVMAAALPPLMLFNGGWRAHVVWALVVAGVMSFVLAAVFAIMYLEKERELKQRRVRLFYYRLPALEALDRAMGRALTAGFGIMTGAGLVVLSGFLAHGEPWRVELLWALYALIAAVRYPGHWRGPRLASLTMVASLAVVAYVFGAPT